MFKKIFTLFTIIFISYFFIHDFYFVTQANSISSDKIGPLVIDKKEAVLAWDFHEVIVTKQRLSMAKKFISMILNAEHKWPLVKTLINPWFWKEVKYSRKKYKTTEKIFNHLKSKYPSLVQLEPQFFEFLKLYAPIPEVLNLIDSLSAQGYKHYLASNISTRPLQDMQKQYPEIFERFAGIYQISAISPSTQKPYAKKPKPDVGYFIGLRRYLSEQGIPSATKIIFIDDATENVEGAQKTDVGIEAIEFKSAKDLQNQLQKKGFNIIKQNVAQPALSH